MTEYEKIMLWQKLWCLNLNVKTIILWSHNKSHWSLLDVFDGIKTLQDRYSLGAPELNFFSVQYQCYTEIYNSRKTKHRKWNPHPRCFSCMVSNIWCLWLFFCFCSFCNKIVKYVLNTKPFSNLYAYWK